MKLIKLLCLGSLIMALAGCAAIGTAIKYGHLDIETAVARPVFLPATETAANKTLYVRVENVSGYPNFKLDNLDSALEANGYKIVDNPNKANYTLQMAILKVTRNSKTAGEAMGGSGMTGAVEGGISGASLALAAGGNPFYSGVGGAVAGEVVDSSVQDIKYVGSIAVDITAKPTKANGLKKTTTYSTAIYFSADRVNLKFEKAEPQLESRLIQVISGLF